MTAFVARHSQDIQWDIERSFSCWGDKATRRTDLDIVQEIGGFWDDDELDAKQARWVSTYSEAFEDRAHFLEMLARELAPSDLRRDDKYGTWASFHHDGLSCFGLRGETLEEAIADFRAGAEAGNRFDPTLGDQTVGAVEYVMTITVDGLEFHILKCESWQAEELID